MPSERIINIDYLKNILPSDFSGNSHFSMLAFGIFTKCCLLAKYQYIVMGHAI